MGYIKDIANQPNLQTFPDATFEIAGDVPQAQCSEARIEGDHASTDRRAPFSLTDLGAFTGWNLTGDICHITENPGGNTGDFDILSNTVDVLILLQQPGNGSPTVYYVSNDIGLIITRDVASFAQFIHAAGYPYTIKGGKLYTNIPSNLLQPACSILFNPLT